MTLRHHHTAFVKCSETPHAPVGSLEPKQEIVFDTEGLISCLYDDMRPDLIGRFGNNIIQLPPDEGGWCVCATGERLLYVVFRPEAGRASVQNAQLRHLDPEGSGLSPRGVEFASSTGQSRDSRSARSVIDFAVTIRLTRHYTLTYADEPDTPGGGAHEFEKFVRRARRSHGPFPWVQVVERGEDNGRLHHHVLTIDSLARRAVSNLWGNGHVLHSRARTASGIRRMAGYLCKTFRTPPDDRLGAHRYRVSRYGMRPKAYGMVVTEAELQTMLCQLASGGSYPWYPSEPVPFHEYSMFWDPYKPG